MIALAANGNFVRSADLYTPIMLHDGRMSGLLKLRRGTGFDNEWPVWVGRDRPALGA